MWSLAAMANRLTFVANLLIGVAAGAATITSAAAQQVELVPFRSVDDGVVIEVGKKPIAKQIPAALPTEAMPLSAETLARTLRAWRRLRRSRRRSQWLQSSGRPSRCPFG